MTHIFSAEGGEISYLKLEPGKELVNVKWTDPVVAAANERADRNHAYYCEAAEEASSNQFQNMRLHAELAAVHESRAADHRDITARDAEIERLTADAKPLLRLVKELATLRDVTNGDGSCGDAIINDADHVLRAAEAARKVPE